MTIKIRATTNVLASEEPNQQPASLREIVDAFGLKYVKTKDSSHLGSMTDEYEAFYMPHEEAVSKIVEILGMSPTRIQAGSTMWFYNNPHLCVSLDGGKSSDRHTLTISRGLNNPLEPIKD